jgi:hypothetical protein
MPICTTTSKDRSLSLAFTVTISDAAIDTDPESSCKRLKRLGTGLLMEAWRDSEFDSWYD